MARLFALLILICLGTVSINGEDIRNLSGQVFEESTVDNSSRKEALIGANVFWVNGTSLVPTDGDGRFTIPRVDETNLLVISHIAYENDTIAIGTQDFLEIVMSDGVDLATIQVKSKKRSTEISYLNPLKTENIGKKELAKAACCNLSESFETSPSVDVSFTDAITGTRQIQLLGLAGPYTQMTRENIPDIRGLSALYGLGHSPGTWVSSIQLNKGTGSVVNGFESIAGQINVELEKPEDADRFFLNLYGNIMGRGEANTHLAHSFNDYLHTGFLAHYSQNARRNDTNGDGFFDNPLRKDIILLNRWRFIGKDNGFRGQAGVKYVNSTHFGGQMAYDGLNEENAPNIWGLDLNNQRLEVWTKTGWVNEEKPWQSVGLQLSAMNHDQVSRFGNNTYDADQQMFYANLVYQGILGNTNHTFKTGASFQYDRFDEKLEQQGFDFQREEMVPGVYGEYAYTQEDKLGIVFGLRGDYHNQYGFFATPRMHARYAPNSSTVLRISAGRGQRTANIFAENFALLASNRTWKLQNTNADTPYGLDAEVAWNYGISLTQDFKLDYREGMVSIDFFRTDFQNQIVIDVDAYPQEVNIYNLNGASFSNSFQAQVDYEVIKRLDLRLAYRWFDVRTDYTQGLLQKPLTSQHRAFVNVGYGTKNHWSFDYTLNWQGSKRIPGTSTNPVEFRREQSSPSFILMNAQVSKTWREVFDLYVGVENIANFRQEDAIIDPQNPFGAYFDASLVWGPIFGRNIYAGLRYRFKGKEDQPVINVLGGNNDHEN